MSESAGSVVKRWVGFTVFLLVVALVAFVMMHRQELKDRFAAIGFEVSPQVADLSESLQLTDAGLRIFTATHPTIDGSQHFNEQCAEVDHSEQGHVLGCYAGDRIHLFDVTDERVSGIVEVTAAHELLHAVWARMGEGDRTLMTAKLREVYDDLVPSHPELAERMSVYEHLSDTAFANELHSVFGTEVRELTPWLEDHYAQWFEQRSDLIDGFDTYHTVFQELQQQADHLQSEMTALRADVEARKQSYGQAVEAFNVDASAFSADVAAGTYAEDPDAQTAVAGALTERRAALDIELADLQGDIDRYNGLRHDLQQLSEVSAELDEQLNSDLAPITTRPTE